MSEHLMLNEYLLSLQMMSNGLHSIDSYNDKFIHKCKMDFVNRDLYKKMYRKEHTKMLEELEKTVPKTAYHLSNHTPFDPENLVIVLVNKGTPAPLSWDVTFTVSYFKSIEQAGLSEVVRQKWINGEMLMNMEKRDWKLWGLTFFEFLQLKHHRPTTLPNEVYTNLQQQIQKIWDECKVKNLTGTSTE